ncbi:uncharacterized protein si:ch73-257c13.2 [Perca fluviatilis]|uniref:uncharacterized protein si:ch73-257c13.2 n=1 Tax=Perca fluviatilis TaxID=8168 RepID=UPI001962D6DB|nr:uncharacterized protein si:ch73-257c13.2 [Perca fluviatilis]
MPLLIHDDGLQQGRLVPKIPHFVEVVPLYNVTDFKSHFRLSRGQVEDVMTMVGPFYTNRQHTKLPVTHTVLACLWTLANQATSRIEVLQTDFKIHHVNPSPSLLFPGQHTSVTSHFMAHRGSTSHIAITFSNNRKQFYSIILTGFCDSERRFCHVNVGHPGSWHDARAFRYTDVARQLELNPQALVLEGMHIIDDSAYPLSLHLMKPYRDNGHLTVRQRHFNRKLNAARVAIEHAFGILKSKFRRPQVSARERSGKHQCSSHNMLHSTHLFRFW